LSINCGDDPAEWEWGQVQTVTFHHVPLSSSGDARLTRIFSGKTVSMQGSMFSLSSAGYVMNHPFDVWYGQVLRMIIDVSDWDNALAVLVPGENAHPFHPHREDQVDLWKNSEYGPMPFSREAVEDNAETVLTLLPRE
jgi:penicillin amidase